MGTGVSVRMRLPRSSRPVPITSIFTRAVLDFSHGDGPTAVHHADTGFAHVLIAFGLANGLSESVRRRFHDKPEGIQEPYRSTNWDPVGVHPNPLPGSLPQEYAGRGR